jgi:hypothetical protein
MITEQDLDTLNSLILDKEINDKEMVLLDKLYNYIKHQTLCQNKSQCSMESNTLKNGL